jgi:OPT family oligopeptide transporter
VVPQHIPLFCRRVSSFFFPANTVLTSLLCSALNLFCNFRDPAPFISPITFLLVSYPMGKFLAFSLPVTSYRIPLPYLPPSCVPLSLPAHLARLIRPITLPHALEFSLNPGPWNIKEHVLVYIMGNVAVANPYPMNAIVTSQMYYGLSMDYWFQLLLVLATQLTGFGLAGLCRRFLVRPASMVWPQNLAVCALLNTLHGKDDAGMPQCGVLGAKEGHGAGMLGRWSKRPMTRYRYFIIVFIASFLFFFLPGAFFFFFSIPRADGSRCRLSFPSALDLFFRMLGSPKQHHRQPAVRRAFRVGNVLPHV